MRVFILARDTAIKQAVQNLIESGVAKPDECDMLTKQLYKLDIKDLMTVIVESYELWKRLPRYVKFYPIDLEAMSMN